MPKHDFKEQLKKVLEDTRIVWKEDPAFVIADRILPLYAMYLSQGMSREDARYNATVEYVRLLEHLLEQETPEVSAKKPYQSRKLKE